jgi:hypothetical protein
VNPSNDPKESGHEPDVLKFEGITAHCKSGYEPRAKRHFIGNRFSAQPHFAEFAAQMA